jgi:hypothetical protein
VTGFLAEVDQLAAALRAEDATSEALQPRVRAVRSASACAPPEALAEAAARIRAAASRANDHVAGSAALLVGALVENGAPVAPLGEWLQERLPTLLSRARHFGELCHEHATLLHPDEEDARRDEPESEELFFGDRYLSRHTLLELASARRHRLSGQAWFSLRLWCIPTVAALSRDKRLRRWAKGHAELPANLAVLWNLTPHVDWLQRLLLCPDDEAFLVLHPATSRGYLLEVSGVAHNFQLHTLLADSLIPPSPGLLGNGPLRHGLAGHKPSPAVAEVAWGVGPRSIDEGSTGVWDLYAWTALTPDGTLPSRVDPEHWVWGEGMPADIPRFEGPRVVLLGPPSYRREWSTARGFAELRVSITLKAELTPDEVSHWLTRMGRAR